MKKITNIKLQLFMSIGMFLISIFMSFSYFKKITNSEADQLTTIAFYVWIFSILAWGIKVIHDIKVVAKMNNNQN